MTRLPDGLARSQIVTLDIGVGQPGGVECSRVSKIEHRGETDLVSIDPAGKESFRL